MSDKAHLIVSGRIFDFAKKLHEGGHVVLCGCGRIIGGPVGIHEHPQWGCNCPEDCGCWFCEEAREQDEL